MLTEQFIRDMNWRRARIMGTAFGLAAIAVLAYFPIVAPFLPPFKLFVSQYVGKEIGEGIAPMLLMLPVFAIYLTPLLVAANYVERFRILCPSCGNLLTPIARAIATRCCPKCNAQIVEGRVRSTAVFERYTHRRTLAFIKYWLWAWAAAGALAVTWCYCDPTQFQRCPHVPLFASLIGTATAGWAWLRTRDRRFMPPCIASCVLLVMGSLLLWNSVFNVDR